MAVQLLAFGGLQVLDDTGALEGLLSQRSRAALFIYLAVERRASRESLVTMFWPESDAENARHALRQSLYHLRKAIGGRDWVDSRGHELVVRDDIRADATAFGDAIERGDAESAVQLYRGPFLDGVHLVDLKPWEAWVDGRRAQCARDFRKASRDVLDARRAAGDLAGAVTIAEQWTRQDPTDDEAQHRLIEALAAAGERADAIRQYEAYARVLEPDGLEPLDETRDLITRLRDEAAPLPALRPVPPNAPETQAARIDAVAPAHAPERRRPPARSSLGVIAGAFAMLALVAVVWGWRTTRAAGVSDASNTSVAIFPFAVRGGDASQFLGNGLVSLLGTALDGAGALRPVDARATFAALAAAGDSTLGVAHGARIASRLGADLFVLGDVVEAGGVVHIDAAAYRGDPGCAAWLHRVTAGAACPDPRPLSTAAVSGSADSVFALVDALAARLLGGLRDPAADRLARVAAVTTASLAAFKVYLQGEDHMRAGRFERAADDYLAAIGLDSTFAVAYYRLALAREWAPLPDNAEAAVQAARRAHARGAPLPTRERMLLDAFQQWRTGDGVEADRSYRTILARYPDDFEAWSQFGEVQFHHGPLLGHGLEESEHAWRRVLAVEPRNVFALTHLARIAASTGRVAAVDSLLAGFDPRQLRSDRRLVELAILRAVATGDSASALSLARELRGFEPVAIWRAAVFLSAFTHEPALMRTVLDELAIDYPNPHLGADLRWMASMLELSRGRVSASRAELARAVASERRAVPTWRRRGFEPVTEWYAGSLPLPYPDSSLMRVLARTAPAVARSTHGRRPFVTELGLGRTIQLEPTRLYTSGVVALRLGDTSRAASAAARLHRMAGSGDANALVRDLDRGLRARIAWHRGSPGDAMLLLQELELHDLQGDIAITPFAARAGERFFRGELLASQGRHAEALRWFASLGVGSVSEIPLLAPAHLRQAEIHERLGNREQAAAHYARFVELWRDADPEFQPHVAVARRRLEALTRRD